MKQENKDILHSSFSKDYKIDLINIIYVIP